MTVQRAHILQEMTWPEFQQAQGEIEVALIPVGATEQHGPSGTFGVDLGRADGFARRLAARTWPRTIAVPVVPYGVSPHHMKFPGTITLTPGTFMAVAEEITDSLYAHGIRKFFFLNGHGGNRPALSVLMQRLMVRYEDARFAWVSFTNLAAEVLRERVQSPVAGHACEGEISQAMVLAPWSVRDEARRPARLRIDPAGHRRHAPIEVAVRFDEITEDGALGDAGQASPELGEAIVTAALERAEAFLKEF